MKTVLDDQGNKWHNEEVRQKRINEGVSCAHYVIPIQCESCWMYNLEGRNLQAGDEEYIMCLRRATLDSITGKSHLTIKSHRGEMLANVRRCERINKTPSYEPRGPMPMGDTIGMGVAVDMLLKSLHARGRIESWVQYDSVRTLRSAATKNYDSSPLGVGEGASFARGMARVRPTSCPTQSEWMLDFLRGMENRMGYDSTADHAVSMEAIDLALEYIKEDAEETDDVEEEKLLYKVGAFICLLTAASLRGYEGFYLDLGALRANIHKGKDGIIPPGIKTNTILTEAVCRNLPHVAIPLLGKFKAEGGISQHVFNLASVTTTGLQPRWWMEKLIEVMASDGRTSGPAFSSKMGILDSSSDYDALFRKYLQRVQENTDLIDKDINVDAYYSTNRTPRKTALTRAKRAGIGKDLQDEMNRWKKIEAAKGKKVKFHMRNHYAEACLLMPVTWLYSYAL